MPYRPDKQPEIDESDEPLLDPRAPGAFRRAYIVTAVIVIIALLVGMLGPIVWRMI